MHARSDLAPKTLGRRSARLVADLYERDHRIFDLAEVRALTGLDAGAARNLVAALVRRGVITRLRPGLFNLVPFELGHEREHMEHPYLVARELVRGKEYYLSHASALDVHQMVTQPQLVVFVTSPQPLRPRTILGVEYRFVRCRLSDLFGLTEHWVTGQDRVVVSDPERTVLDCLKQPEHCGGLVEVAKGLWMRRDALDPPRLVDYALRLGVGAVAQRLGYLLEVYQIGSTEEVERLRAHLAAGYALLDPVLPPAGRYLRRWRVRLNVPDEELTAVVGT